MSGARRVAIVSLLVLLAVGLLLVVLPLDVAAVRVGGVGLLWWYAAVAPVVAAGAAIVALRVRSRAGAEPEEPSGR